MPYVSKNWCAHPCHLGTSSNGTKIYTKFGPKPTHPVGSRRVSLALANYINRTCSIILSDPSLQLNDDQLLCTTCYESEIAQFEETQNDYAEEMPDSGDTREVQQQFVIDKLNDVFEMFQLEPVVPRNTGQTREKIDRIYLMLQDWSSCLTTNSKHENTVENFASLHLSVSEVEDFFYRIRCLFDKSNYHEQIVLLQTSPVEWGWKKIQQFFRCTTHQARAAVLQRTEYSDLSKPIDRRGNKPFDGDLSQLIQDFFLDDEVSRQSSSTKDTRTHKDIGTVVIRYMTMSIGESFELFKSKYPDVKVCRSKFYSLRPSWVREDNPHQTCMCIQHQNIDLLLAAVSNTLGNRFSGSVLVDRTVCNFPSEDCYNCRCDNCCNINVSDLFMIDDIDGKPDTNWSLWVISNNHIELQHFTGSFRSLIDQLNGRWSSFITHTYITRQQRDYIKTIKLTSSLTTFAVIQVDFAQNFSFVVQKEIQSAFWNQKQATLYTIVITVGDEHRNMVIVSNHMVHDTTFVYCAQKLIVTFIRTEYPTVNKINYVSDGAPAQYKNNYNIMNLALHQQDFSLKAAWTFTSSGHGKSPCDGLGAVVKSAARKHLLKNGPEAAFCSPKDFYEFTLEKTSRTLSLTKSVRRSKPSDITTNNDSTDEEVDTIGSRPTRSIEIRWLDTKEVEQTFQKTLKKRWSQLSNKDRIAGIRGFHEFDAMFTGTVVCRSVSNSSNSKSFQFKQNSNFRSFIARVLDSHDFSKGNFLIVEQDDVLYLAQINVADLRKDQLTICLFSPPLPTKKFSASKSAPLIISTINVIGRLIDPPTKTTTNTITLTDGQFDSIQDLCDEF